MIEKLNHSMVEPEICVVYITFVRFKDEIVITCQDLPDISISCEYQTCIGRVKDAVKKAFKQSDYTVAKMVFPEKPAWAVIKGENFTFFPIEPGKVKIIPLVLYLEKQDD